MTTAATTLLGLALPVTGELSGTWGDTVNNSITSLLDTAVAGTTTLSTDADVTLTTTTLASNQARQAILLCSGSRTGIKTITAPAQSKIYTIINATTGGYAVKLVGVGPTTGLTIPNGASAVVAWNGSDFIEVGSATVGNLTVNGNLSVTGTTSLTGVATLTANPVLSGGTANGVAYLNGSKVVTTGSALTFDGTIFKVTGTQRLQAASTGSTANGYQLDAGAQAHYWYLGSNTLSTFEIGSSAGQWNWANSSGEQMRLTSTGLGIGTSSPNSKLQVQGLIRTSSSAAGLQIDRRDTSASAYTLYSTAGNLQFYNGTSDTMVLDSSGNLGLGVTPGTWTVGKALEINTAGMGVWAYSSRSALIANYNFNSGDKFAGTGYAAFMSVANDGIFRWYQSTASGTAGAAATMTNAMTLDASGNLGIGTTTTNTGKLIASLGSSHVFNVELNGSTLGSTNGVLLTNYLSQTTRVAGINLSATAADAGAIIFGTASGGTLTERARIDSSGVFLVGKTAYTSLSTDGCTFNPSGYVQTSYTSSPAAYFNRNGTDGDLVNLNKAGTKVGSISVTGSATAYNTSSDYRLKDNQQPLTGSGEFIDALQPKTWNWKTDGSKGIGFIAHEVQAVSPGSVVGEKDAVDEEGNPKYQAMEYGSAEFIANIIAELQSLRQRLAVLEAK